GIDQTPHGTAFRSLSCRETPFFPSNHLLDWPHPPTLKGTTLALLETKNLPQDFPRHYVPASTDLGSWDSVAPLYQELENRSLSSPAQLEKWLQDWGELEDAVGEEGSLRYIRMTCKTDDPAIEKSYLDFLEKIVEPAKPAYFRLQKKYWDCPHRRSLSKDYALFDRSVENQLALYREENIPLETELDKLSQQYQKLSGSMTVQ